MWCRDDATILAPYVRMRSTGVPLPAIKHKMTMDKVAPRYERIEQICMLRYLSSYLLPNT